MAAPLISDALWQLVHPLLPPLGLRIRPAFRCSALGRSLALDAVVLDVLRRCYSGFDGDAETTHNSYRLDLNQIIPSKFITEEV